MNKPRVLLLCSANAAMSQMAEAFLRSYAGGKYETYSAEIDPKEIHPLTIKALGEIGIKMDNQYAKALQEYMGKVYFSYLMTVCAEAEKMPYSFSWHVKTPALGY